MGIVVGFAPPRAAGDPHSQSTTAVASRGVFALAAGAVSANIANTNSAVPDATVALGAVAPGADLVAQISRQLRKFALSGQVVHNVEGRGFVGLW